MDDGGGGNDQLSPATRALQTELHELRRMVQSMRQEVTCGACRCIMEAPVALPCGHTFCSECARRSLLLRARCLEAHCGHSKKIVTAAHLNPVRSLEAIALSFYNTADNNSSNKKINNIARVRGEYRPYLPDKNKRLLLRHLKELKLNTDGAIDELAERYRDFVVRWNANLDKANPLPINKVVDLVTKAERDRRNALVKKKSNMFRKKIGESPSQKCKGDKNASSPEEGDDFNTLIEKLCQRENRTINRNNFNNGHYNGTGNRPAVEQRRDQAVRAGNTTESDLNVNNNGNGNSPAMEDGRRDEVMRTGSLTESNLAFMECSSEAAIIASQNSQQPVEQTEESEEYKSCNDKYNTSETTTMISAERTAARLRPSDDTQSTVPPPTPNRTDTTSPASLFQKITQVPPGYGAGTISIGPRRPSQRAAPPSATNETTPTRSATPIEAPSTPSRNTGQTVNAGPPLGNLTIPDRNTRSRGGDIGPPSRNLTIPDRSNSRGVDTGPPSRDLTTLNRNTRQGVDTGPPPRNISSPDRNGHPSITINIMPPNEAPVNDRSAYDFNSHSPNRNVGDVPPPPPTSTSTQPSISINIMSQNEGPPTTPDRNAPIGPARLTPQRRLWTAPSPSVVSPPRNVPHRPWSSPTSHIAPPGQQARAHHTPNAQQNISQAQPPRQQISPEKLARSERNRRRAVELQLAKRRRIAEEKRRVVVRR